MSHLHLHQLFNSQLVNIYLYLSVLVLILGYAFIRLAMRVNEKTDDGLLSQELGRQEYMRQTMHDLDMYRVRQAEEA